MLRVGVGVGLAVTLALLGVGAVTVGSIVSSAIEREHDERVAELFDQMVESGR